MFLYEIKSYFVENPLSKTLFVYGGMPKSIL